MELNKFAGLDNGSNRYTIYYMRPTHMANMMLGTKFLIDNGIMPDVSSINKTHVELGAISANNLDNVYMKMQGEMWSPFGEANNFIITKELRHTSMSIGDIVYDHQSSKYFMCDTVGFTELNNV